MPGTNPIPLVFTCRGQRLVGVIEQSREPASLGILIVTGGPQYRVGSHRQFVSIARQFAAAGYSTMRFDYRGMGDAEGEGTTFDNASDDIREALDSFQASTGLQSFVLWGLCDAASACLIYGNRDARVVGMILLNPWVRSDVGLAKAYVRYYYLKRIVSRGFWRKTLSGRLPGRKVISDLVDNLRTAFGSRIDRSPEPLDSSSTAGTRDFRVEMLKGLRSFSGRILFLNSTADLTAAEFLAHVKASREWSQSMRRKNVSLVDLAGMDHTFSRREWRDEVTARCLRWVSSSETR